MHGNSAGERGAHISQGAPEVTTAAAAAAAALACAGGCHRDAAGHLSLNLGVALSFFTHARLAFNIQTFLF